MRLRGGREWIFFAVSGDFEFSKSDFDLFVALNIRLRLVCLKIIKIEAIVGKLFELFSQVDLHKLLVLEMNNGC